MSRTNRIAVVCLLTLLTSGVVFAQRRNARRAKRVTPPKFSEAKVKGYFFADVFAELKGERPDLTKAAPSPGAPGGTGGTGNSGGGASKTVAGWAAVISSESIENEIKSIKMGLDKTITTPGAFRGGGFKACRREFSIAAMLFGIITEYDGDVRFKKNSSGMRDALARTGFNCKVGTTQVYNESKQRRDDLQDVLGGSPYQGKEGDPDVTWDKICDRSPVMQRLDVALQERLQPAISSDAEFKKSSEVLVREAELVAAMAMVLMKEGMEDYDGEDYREFCEQMQQGAVDIVSGVEQENYDLARKGAGAIGQACTTCHENYRG